jgi:hypothetical protein
MFGPFFPLCVRHKSLIQPQSGIDQRALSLNVGSGREVGGGGWVTSGVAQLQLHTPADQMDFPTVHNDVTY